MVKPEPPLVVTKAAEIFGGIPEVGARGDFVSWAEYGAAFLQHLKETQPFNRIHGTNRYKVDGHESSKCRYCYLVVHIGSDYKGKPMQVDVNGEVHKCGQKKGSSYEWGF